jgi:hypothetical protein
VENLSYTKLHMKCPYPECGKRTLYIVPVLNGQCWVEKHHCKECAKPVEVYTDCDYLHHIRKPKA